MQRLYKLDKNIDILNDFREADKFILKVIVFQWILVSTFGGWFYDTHLFGFVSGGLLSLISYIGYRNYAGTSMLRIINSLILMTFAIIIIQQNLGRIEMHFHIFAMLSFVVAYKDIKPVTIGAIYIILHHLLFTYLQFEGVSFAGMDIIVFNYGCGYDIAFLHAFFVILEWIVLIRLISIGINNYQNMLDDKNKINILNKELNQHKQTLESEVMQKTKELQLLNESLEQTIKDEVEKNHQKDVMINSQSRLASMGEMIGNIAHQWRQPLNALGITVQKMQRFHQMGRLDEEVINKSVEKSMMLINKMSDTIDDFMGFFRPDKTKVKFDVGEVIEETVNLLEASLKNNFIEVNIIRTDDDANIDGYRGEFTQVILNIISNAKDILLEKNIKQPTINIAILKENDVIIITIEDNGGGVPETIIDKVFDPYFTTKEQGKGTGIGLYMSKMIIEENIGGKISVENRDIVNQDGKPSCGACFIINFNQEILLEC